MCTLCFITLLLLITCFNAPTEGRVNAYDVHKYTDANTSWSVGHLVSQLILVYCVFIFVLDQAPPVFTYCPNDIVIDNASTLEIRVNWQQPTATDNSGVPPSVSLTTNRPSGAVFAVPGSYEVKYKAVDGAGLEAICSFRITLKRMYMVVL